MAMMSAIGTAAFMSSRTDIMVSQNTRVSRQAFYIGDGGVEISPKVIRRIAEDAAMPAVSNVTLDAGFLNEVMGYSVEDAGADTVYPSPVNPDMALAMNETEVNVDIDRTGTGFMSGSGVEFASGAEGSGVSGGILIFFTIEALGSAPSLAEAHLDAYYRYVVGVAGGK